MGIERGGWESAALVERLVADPSALVEDVVLKPVKIVERMSTAAFASQDQQILKALLFIHQNVRKKISVRDVMTEAALSRRLLERRFKDVTGKTLYEYITDQKLKCFAEQLQDTDEQVVNIALSMGENDPKSIARRFKQLYGCTPVEWREKQRNKNTDL
jgi:LacI family transcriptional regulator